MEACAIADTGFVITGTAITDSSYGDRRWNNEDNAETDDNNRASVTLASPSSFDESEYLKATNFGHSIPAGATIDGIEVQHRRENTDSSDDCHEERIRLVDELGAIGTTDRADGADLPNATEETVQHGGSTDLWGDTWGETDVEDTDFGFVIAFMHTSGGSLTIGVEAMWTKIYYTESGGGDLSINVNDSITVSESVEVRFDPLLINVNDVVVVSEDVTVILAQLIISVNDEVTITEFVHVEPLLMPNVSDEISVVDVDNVDLLVMPQVSDDVSVVDAPVVDAVLNPQVFDAITVADVDNVDLLIMPQVSDSVSVTEAVTVSLVVGDDLSISVFDEVTVSESVSVVGPGAVRVQRQDSHWRRSSS